MRNIVLWRYLILAACLPAALTAFTIAGCGSGSSAPVVQPSEIHAEKVAYVGGLSGTLADEIEKIFINRVPYDGKSTDMPIIIAAQSMDKMTPDVRKGIVESFLNLRPIVLAHCTGTEINDLLGMLGLERNYVLPEGLPGDRRYAELFAVDREEDGHVFIWSMYPPGDGAEQSSVSGAPSPETDVDDDVDQMKRAEIFHGWIDEDTMRVTPEVKARRREAVKSLVAAVKADSAELTNVANGFVMTKIFSNQGNIYQISYFIYACHSFNAADALDYDWFYVRQEGIFNASGAYKGIVTHYQDMYRSEVHYYIGSYVMDNWMEGLTTATGGVSLMAAEPQNANNVAQVTSGISYNIGGSIGYQGGESGGVNCGLNAGVTVSHSTTLNVSDCTVNNRSADNVNNASWSYDFKRADQSAKFGYTALDPPPVLSRSNFQPVNQWLWKFSPSVRNANKNWFYSRFTAGLIQSIGGYPRIFWLADDASHYLFQGGEWKFEVPLSYPPLLVAPLNLDFSAAGQYKQMNLAVSRHWTASSNQSWLRVEPVSGAGVNPRVYVTVDPNTTGESRTAVITFATSDGKGSAATTVFQARY